MDIQKGIPTCRALGSKIVVLPDGDKEELSRGGIIIPLTLKSQLAEGTVILVSKDVSVLLKEGDRVLFPKTRGVEHTFNGDKYLIMDGPTDKGEGDIWFII